MALSRIIVPKRIGNEHAVVTTALLVQAIEDEVSYYLLVIQSSAVVIAIF